MLSVSVELSAQSGIKDDQVMLLTAFDIWFIYFKVNSEHMPEHLEFS